MNERIKKLADKIWSLDIESNPHFQLCLQSFSESIVQECVTWVNDNVGMVDEEARADLLKHFGVEE